MAAEAIKATWKCVRDPACREAAEAALKRLRKHLGEKVSQFFDELILIWDAIGSDPETEGLKRQAEDLKERIERLEETLRDNGVIDADTKRELELWLDRVRSEAGV